MELFGSSGVRGVANSEVTPGLVCRVGAAAATVWDTDRVAVARDTRTTGPMLADAVSAGVASAGADVDRLGVVPTPGVQAYAERAAVPALVVTASHNPPEYNGLKLVAADGGELTLDALAAVEAAVDDAGVADWDAVGQSRRVAGAGSDYVDGLLGAVDRERIAAADLHVALDPGHGAGCHTSPEFFRRLGCRVSTVHAQPDGRFPGRDPEPVADNLGDLGRLVSATDADLGVAHDGDADRAVFFDETGALVEGDASLAALAADTLGEGDVAVGAVNVSQRLVDVVEAAGATLELTPIGSTHILSRVRELRAEGEAVPVAGEGNGGVVFPDYRLARDGAYTAARFLALLADGQTVSDAVAAHAGYHNVRVNVEYASDAERAAMLEAAQRYATTASAEVTTIDGYRLDYGDAWVLARGSGTEPVVRVYAEARDPDRAADLAEGAARVVRAARDDA